MGTTLLKEYEDVLGRASLFRRSRLDAVERNELFDIFLSSCRWTPIYFRWRPNLPDSGDDHLIELAVAGSAVNIVSRNLKHLTRGELLFPGLKAISPEQFLKETMT